MCECRPRARSRLRRVAEVLDKMQGVIGHTLVSPRTADREQWTLSVQLRGGGVPSAVLTILGEYHCELHDSQPDGDRWTFAVTAE